MSKKYKIKYIPTGNVFKDFTKEQCDELMLEDPNNFEVLDPDYKMPVVEVEQSNVSASIIDKIEDSDEDDEDSELDGEEEEIDIEDDGTDAEDEDDEDSELDGEEEEKAKPVSKMNVKELIAYCEKNNLKTDETMKKADILAVIKSAG